MAQFLVVDDEEDIRDLLKELLTDWGHHVITAPNGESAINIMTQNKNVEGVLLDKRMPGMTGFDVLRQINEKHIRSQVVMVTADVGPDSYEQLLSLGAKGIVTKPFEVATLKNQLTKYLPGLINRK
jgi:CheY-like chemotaxis protein